MDTIPTTVTHTGQQDGAGTQAEPLYLLCQVFKYHPSRRKRAPGHCGLMGLDGWAQMQRKAVITDYEIRCHWAALSSTSMFLLGQMRLSPEPYEQVSDPKAAYGPFVVLVKITMGS